MVYLSLKVYPEREYSARCVLSERRVPVSLANLTDWLLEISVSGEWIISAFKQPPLSLLLLLLFDISLFIYTSPQGREGR